MSAKFASLTAGLLVRKGEAVPSSVVASQATSVPRTVHRAPAIERISDRGETPTPRSAPTFDKTRMVTVSPTEMTSEPDEVPMARFASQFDKTRRLMVTLTHSEYQILGLIAVKKGTTRQHLSRLAFEEYLALLVEEYGESCACIDSRQQCNRCI